jgi:hypothetical protein
VRVLLLDPQLRYLLISSRPKENSYLLSAFDEQAIPPAEAKAIGE